MTAINLTDAERRLLRALFDNPHDALAPEHFEAVNSLMFRTPRLIADVYLIADGFYIARITDAGRQALVNA